MERQRGVTRNPLVVAREKLAQQAQQVVVSAGL